MSAPVPRRRAHGLAHAAVAPPVGGCRKRPVDGDGAGHGRRTTTRRPSISQSAARPPPGRHAQPAACGSWLGLRGPRRLERRRLLLRVARGRFRGGLLRLGGGQRRRALRGQPLLQQLALDAGERPWLELGGGAIRGGNRGRGVARGHPRHERPGAVDDLVEPRLHAGRGREGVEQLLLQRRGDEQPAAVGRHQDGAPGRRQAYQLDALLVAQVARTQAPAQRSEPRAHLGGLVALQA